MPKDDGFERRVGTYGRLAPQLRDDWKPEVPVERQHDIPPHCRPSSTGTQCCVGCLKGKCRKCGENVWAASNIECPADPAPPWGWRDWYNNWETHGR